MKRLLAALLLLSVAALLGGCAPRVHPEATRDIALPMPSAGADDCFLGEQIESRRDDVTLYGITGDESSFTANRREISSKNETECLKTALDMLLSGTGLSADLEFSCGIATARLDVAAFESETQKLTALTLVGNTLLSLDFVEGVNVLFGDHAAEVASLPFGIQTEIIEGVTPAYAQLSAERTYFLESETGTIPRRAALYYPSSDGKRFIPEIRAIDFDSANYAATLVRALAAPSRVHDCVLPAIPDDADFLADNPVIAVSSAGERVLTLNFSSEIAPYLAANRVEQWQFLGSLALTLCSFVPEIDALRVLTDGQPIVSCIADGKPLTFDDGLIRRSDFDRWVGDAVSILVPDGSGGFREAQHPASQRRGQSPLERVAILLDNEEGTFPEGVSRNDLLGLRVEDGLATVNLSANFYHRCQGADGDSERAMVYAIVNTLCLSDDIRSVKLLVEGMTGQTLAGEIFLMVELLPCADISGAEATATP